MALPLDEFEWMSEEKLRNYDPIKDATEEEGFGYILEVTLRYPPELHLEHNAWPLAPELVDLTEEDLSPFSRQCLREARGGDTRYRARKLTSTFRTREHYVVHALNLRLYVELGMELVTVHRGIRFHQARFMKPYISDCTDKRAAARTKAEKCLLKLKCNR